MRPRACHLLIAIALLGTTQANTLGTTQADTKKVYPNRWVRISSGLREDADVEKIRKQANKIIRTMSGDVSKSCRVLSNNYKAENGLECISSMMPMSAIKFNISLN